MAKPRDYELVLVLSPAIDDETATGTVERIHGVITAGGGTLGDHQPWGMRRLAYTIQDFNEGNYFLTRFTTNPASTNQLENALRLSEEVIRHLLVKVEEK